MCPFIAVIATPATEHPVPEQVHHGSSCQLSCCCCHARSSSELDFAQERPAKNRGFHVTVRRSFISHFVVLWLNWFREMAIIRWMLTVSCSFRESPLNISIGQKKKINVYQWCYVVADFPFPSAVEWRRRHKWSASEKNRLLFWPAEGKSEMK